VKSKVREGHIIVAGREIRRMANAGVGRSFAKTVTEPLTNSYSNLKKQANVAHKAGLVDKILELKEGDAVVTFELKKALPPRKLPPICIYVSTHGRTSRRVRVVDQGTGMSADELEYNFGRYAEAKARGEGTRSLFGRGALDVLLYHEQSEIYSVKEGTLSRCTISVEGRTKWKVDDLGRVNQALLKKHDLPDEIVDHGTVVQVVLRDGTNIPLEDQILKKLSNFYMLRLIGSDPNCDVFIVRDRKATGVKTDKLQYDFPIGTVIARLTEDVDLHPKFKCALDIVVARSEEELPFDPDNIELRAGGLLFVDEFDAVLDLTLHPEYDRNPNLRHLFGIVRVTGIRPLLEQLLDERDAEAVLTVSRDGFDQRNAVTKVLFAAVERLVKPVYDAEEQRVRKGRATRSARLEQRMRDALKIINQFNADETKEPGTQQGGTTPVPLDEREAISFDLHSTTLYATVPKRLYAYVNLRKVDPGEVIIFESSNPEIKVQPDAVTVEHSKDEVFTVPVTVTCNLKNQTGDITATTLDKAQNSISATATVAGVEEPPVTYIPETIEFGSQRYAGDPNRDNKAILLVNTSVLSGKPEVVFKLDKIKGDITFKDGATELKVRVRDEDLSEDGKLARLVVTYRGTGWGQSASLTASSTTSIGVACSADTKIAIIQQKETDRFSKIWYEDLRNPTLGDVISDALYINAWLPLHKEIFGESQEEFDEQLETNPIAQLRAASVLAEIVVYHTAHSRYKEGGKNGLYLDTDPITSLRTYLDASRKDLERQIIRKLAPEAVALFTR
jgi:hypothetical protein